jgi:hypothetical protein
MVIVGLLILLGFYLFLGSKVGSFLADLVLLILTIPFFIVMSPILLIQKLLQFRKV